MIIIGCDLHTRYQQTAMGAGVKKNEAAPKFARRRQPRTPAAATKCALRPSQPRGSAPSRAPTITAIRSFTHADANDRTQF